MTSVFEQALGPDFARLHPMLQRRFALHSSQDVACLGRGVMSEVRRGPWWTVPFLLLGTWRHILFPDSARDVPFLIENYAYVDSHGRETVTFVRTFELSPSKRRRFDATMVFDAQRRQVVDYLGTHQHLAVDLVAEVADDGALLLRSGEQRFREGPVDFRFPLALSGTAELREGYDDERGCFTIDVQVRNRWLGPLFSYRGSFTCSWPAVSSVPRSVKPLREEPRS